MGRRSPPSWRPRIFPRAWGPRDTAANISPRVRSSPPFRSPPGRNIPLDKGRTGWSQLAVDRAHHKNSTGISTRALGWSLSRAANSVVLITSSLGGGLEVYSVLSLLIPGSPAAAALRLPPAPGMDMTNLRSSDRPASLAYDRKTQRGTHTCQPRACRGPASTWRAAAHAA